MTHYSETISSYAADVERFFEQNSQVIISNKDKEHAAVLMSTLFKKADKTIIIFSQQLDGQFYSREAVRSELIAAIERGVSVKILTQQTPVDSELLTQLHALKSGGNLSIETCSNGSRGAISFINFAVVDGRAYRLEKNRDTCEAFACANDVVTAQKLESLFKSFTAA